MLTAETVRAFRKEASKASFVGRAGKSGMNFAKDTFNAFTGAFNPKSIREGAKRLSNTHPEKRKELAEAVVRKNKALREAGRSGQYVADDGKGIVGYLRRAGFLGNVSKYQGTDKLKKTQNRISRALPGAATGEALMTGGSAVGDLTRKEDADGRKIGLGERVGAATLNVTGSLASHNIPRGKGKAGWIRDLAVSGIAGEASSQVGRRAGRLADKGVARLRKKSQQVSEAAGAASAPKRLASPPAPGAG